MKQKGWAFLLWGAIFGYGSWLCCSAYGVLTEEYRIKGVNRIYSRPYEDALGLCYDPREGDLWQEIGQRYGLLLQEKPQGEAEWRQVLGEKGIETLACDALNGEQWPMLWFGGGETLLQTGVYGRNPMIFYPKKGMYLLDHSPSGRCLAMKLKGSAPW